MKKKLLSFVAISFVAVASAFLFSAFVGGEITDEAVAGGDIQAGGEQKCYIERWYPCGPDDATIVCEFTGVYGAPYTCTSSSTCFSLHESRRCVLKQ